MRTKVGALTIGTVLLMAACGSTGDQSFDGAWVLTSASVDGASITLLDEYSATLTVEGTQIGGRAACNSYGGDATIDGTAFATGLLMQTMMACEPQVMELEATYLAALGRVTSATRSNDALRLLGNGVELDFELEPPVPTEALVGVTWVLDSLLQRDAVSSTTEGAEQATLVLNADGSFTGHTGCRELSGEYIVSGATVQLTSFSAEGECRDQYRFQDNVVISVLESGFSTSIDGNRLTIGAPGGEGLVYRLEA
jgi:heat shock protein HslJ